MRPRKVLKVDSFDDFVKSLGLLPKGPIEPTGKWERCKTETSHKNKNGAYKLTYTRRGNLIGFAMDFKIHTSPEVWMPGKEHRPNVNFRISERDYAAEAEARKKAVESAVRHYHAAKPLSGEHPYLKAKGLTLEGCYGVRVDSYGHLVIPMMIDGEIISIQRISNEGDKLFWPGAPTSGAYYIINRPNASVTVLCEGFATGLTVFSALKNCRVVVGFNAGNLPKVAQQGKGSLFKGLAAVAADNDWKTQEMHGKNPGVECGEKAAKILGCGISFPKGIDGSDWDDYRMQKIKEREELRLSTLRTGGREADSDRVVKSEIAMAIMRSASYV